MLDLTYPPVLLTARTLMYGIDMRFDLQGQHHVPRRGGAVIACNHISYIDFVLVGYVAFMRGRMVRFMAKKELFDQQPVGLAMRSMHHIPVDRSAGAGAFTVAVEALQRGELVGIFPEMTISRSFEIKAMKDGAARLAAQAGVPLIPMVEWGGQRMATKGHQPNLLQRGLPIVLRVGTPLRPDPELRARATTNQLRDRMRHLLQVARTDYPDRPTGLDDSWWLPHSMGGTAPTLEEADAMDRTRKMRIVTDSPDAAS